MKKTGVEGGAEVVQHRHTSPVLKPLCAAIALLGAQTLLAQEAETLRTSPIVVTPTRVEQSSFDLPVSIDAFDRQTIQDQKLGVNASEVLVRAPGVVANERQNYAQDLQISIRGFGSRSSFGVRGIRLIADGIPLTMPDGQGQAANIDLGSARQIEVLRGPFSSLYGNSSGGVIQVFTEDGPERPTATADAAYGSFDTSRYGLKLGGQGGSVNYIASVTRFDTNGYRDHSGATRDTFNGKLRFDLSEDTKVTWLVNYLDQPETLDPLGLDRATAQSNPTSVRPQAITFNTRKSVDNVQTGLVLDQRVTDRDGIRLLGYLGDRQVQQFLGFAGSFGNSNGGVIDLDRQFGGLDLRWSHKDMVADRPLTVTVGANYDRQIENRKGFVNNNGSLGALRRDEDDTVYNFDQYLQGEWQFADSWSLSAGVRHSVVKFTSEDFFLSNGDDSGSIRFSEITPVVGVLYKITPVVNLYANFGEGFETPTFSELAYRPDGTLGLNFDLQPAISKNYEVGAKMLIGSATRLNAAVFQIDTKDEIVVATSSLGRTTFQNAGKTERMGVELLVDSKLGGGFGVHGAYTYLNAEYAENIATPLTSIAKGTKIPGIPENRLFGELSWEHIAIGFSTAIEVRYSDKVYANDSNSEAAGSYMVASWRAGLKQEIGAWKLSEFIRVDNITDEQYIGSVIVNEGNGNYYEPAPDRNYLIGVTASYRF